MKILKFAPANAMMVLTDLIVKIKSLQNGEKIAKATSIVIKKVKNAMTSENNVCATYKLVTFLMNSKQNYPTGNVWVL